MSSKPNPTAQTNSANADEPEYDAPYGRRLLDRLLLMGRNLRCQKLFGALKSVCAGDVLDVGGSDFFVTAKQKGIAFSTWTTLEKDSDRLFSVAQTGDSRHRVVVADGADMSQVFEDETFDTLLNIHVLEHVVDPVAMVRECSRVLKKGGTAVFLIPQTASVHHAPEVYYNFTRYWGERVLPKCGLELVSVQPLGGLWTTIASRMFFFFFQAAGEPTRGHPDVRRSPWFYLLFPVMAIYAIVSIPFLMILGLGDLHEEANNHLYVAKKS